MSAAKLAVVAGVTAIALSGCGSAVKPVAGRGRIDDPRTQHPNHVKCLLAHHLPARLVGSTELQIGPLPGGPTVVFTPTAGIAQGDQVQAKAPGAEVIGSALLYPNQAPDAELSAVEACLAQGVQG